MSARGVWRACGSTIGMLLLGMCTATVSFSKMLDLTGYQDDTGAITVQRGGDTVDPYFSLQALVLANAHGLDISAQASPWSQWLTKQYRTTGQLHRFCKQDHQWVACKPADAEDASLALWLTFLNTVPTQKLQTPQLPRLQKRVRTALQELRDPQSGLYKVSRQIPHSLFMDNLEVWSAAPTRRHALAIQRVFWDADLEIYRVSTQADHPHPMAVFYPDAAAQLYPLLMKFPSIPSGASAFYKQWMAKHRRQWLSLMRTDFPWGLIALVAWEQGDLPTVICWQLHALPLRHGMHWTVTDEVIAQILPPQPESPMTPEDCT